jgi:endonuclease/exonuclease/phosphatase family metal-dependent hydrolase
VAMTNKLVYFATMAQSVEKQRSRFGIFRLSLLLINIIAALLLLVVQIAPQISPKQFWLLELMAYSYPFLLLINIGFIIYWGIFRNKFALISLFIIIIGYDKLQLFYRPSFLVFEEPVAKNSIKVMSYNVRLFDLYNWSGNTKTRSKIFDLLSKETPDITCFQEYYHSDKPDFSNNDTLNKILKSPYRQVEYGLTLYNDYHWGLATYSKYPVINKGLIFFKPGSTNFGMFCDVLYKGDTIRIYNVHLQSNHFKKRDYEFMANPDSGSNEDMLRGALSIMKHLKKGVLKRTEQVDELRAHIESCEHPAIICGDFNDPPYSYAYNKICHNFSDCFIEKGKGFGISYNGSFLPYRIDYILHSDYFECLKYSMIRKKLSDHYPVIVTLKTRNKQN